MADKKKRNAVIRLVISAVILSGLISVLVMGIKGGSGFPFLKLSFWGNSYPDADKYTAGDISYSTEKLDEVEIDWVSGSIQIELYDGDNIEINEAESDKLSDKERVHSYYDNGTLYIQFRKGGIFDFNSGDMKKELYIRIPRKLYSEPGTSLNKLRIDNVSADITVNELPVKECFTDTVSGDITFNSNFDRFELSSVSGNAFLISSVTPRNIEADTVSGDVIITVPSNSEFSIEHDSVSGNFNNAFPTVSDNKENNWKFDTVSGDVSIHSLNL